MEAKKNRVRCEWGEGAASGHSVVSDAYQTSIHLLAMHRPFQALLRHELDLLGLATKERGKVGIVVVNKWDLIPQAERVAVRKHIMSTFERLSEYEQTPVIFTSAQTRQNLSTIITRCLVSNIHQ